ncbi:unnamed protein product [Cylindrotheca closterium]|uniref:Uncharacterized protein n=1 Tax=Cylindrotheca closterium TaxID=2856 RepID=A0AAD2FK60_9STRA|nr:unnamed protein product [Cylindrotheca closterium]
MQNNHNTMQVSDLPSIYPEQGPSLVKKRKLSEVNPAGAASAGAHTHHRRAVRIVGRSNSQATNDSTVDPQISLLSMLRRQGVDGTTAIAVEKANTFFDDVITEAELEAYDQEVLRAIRDSDLETLRSFYKSNRPLKCSNRFGESLLHLACRKSLSPVVKLLVYEAGVPLNIRDDMGRSPLHDAFWTPTVNCELVDLILNKCPDLLLLPDKRGHTPLNYARKDHWPEWNKYLEDRQHMILPKTLNLPMCSP